MKGRFIAIYDFMLELDLTPSELMVYALIYQFSEDGAGELYGTQEYICERTKLSRPSVQRALKSLAEKGLIEREKHRHNGSPRVSYKAQPQNDAVEQKAQPQNDAVESIKMMPSINKYNKKDNKKPTFNFKNELLSLGVEPQALEDWLMVRKKKKASNTKTALNGFLTQVEKSGKTVNEVVRLCAERSWTSFSAEWLLGSKQDKQQTEPKIKFFE